MNNILEIDTINAYNDMVGYPTVHPLVSVVDFSKTNKQLPGGQLMKFGFYIVFYKEEDACIIRYGRHAYDYQVGTLVFIAPGQVVSFEEDGHYYKPSGKALLFHPDLLLGTHLEMQMPLYGYFSYNVNEALHISEREKKIIFDCLQQINYEADHAIDKHSKKLIVSNIELFLDYCTRFYDRQFQTRQQATSGIIEKFDQLIDEYFRSDKLQLEGIPSIGYFADAFHLSVNYFGEMIKKLTGKTTLEHIQLKLINMAKDKISLQDKTINQISDELGFKYPQHFTRLFKQKTGVTPNEYRTSKAY